MDVHSYAYLARRAFASLIPRLGSCGVRERLRGAGQPPEELPEVILACARVARVDFNKVWNMHMHMHMHMHMLRRRGCEGLGVVEGWRVKDEDASGCWRMRGTASMVWVDLL